MSLLERIWHARKSVLAGPRLVIACRHGEDDARMRLTFLGKKRAFWLANRINQVVAGEGGVAIFTSPAECAQETARIIADQLGEHDHFSSIQKLYSSSWFDGKILAETLFQLTPRSCGAIVVVAHMVVSSIIDAVEKEDGREGLAFTAVSPGCGICLDRRSGTLYDLP